MTGLNYSVSCSDKHAIIAVELEAFFHIGCCSVEVDLAGLGSITEGVCTCDREYLCQVLDRAVSVESICKSYNGIGVCLSTAERTDLTVVDILSVQSCVNGECIAYSVYSAVAELTVDVIDVDGSCVNVCRSLGRSLGRSFGRTLCGFICRSFGRCCCGLVCRSLCGSLGRLSAARSEGTNELEVIDLDLVLVDDSGKHIVCNSQSSHRVGDLSLAGCGYLILGNDQRAVVGIEVERVFIKFRCRSVVGDSAYDTCVSSGLVLSYREYLVDILEGRTGSLDVLLIDLFEDGSGVVLLALQGADIAAFDLSAVEVGVYCELVADVEFLLVGDVALKVVDLYDSLITGCRCICRSLCGSYCRSLCGSYCRSLCGFVGRSFCRNLSGFDCRFVGRSLCGSLCGSLCRELRSLESHRLGESLVYYFALIDDSGESRVGNCQSLESCLDVSCAGSNYGVGCSDQRACIGVELEAFFHIGCCSVEVDGTGRGSVSEGVSTCDREYIKQVLDGAVSVKSIGKSYNRIGVCLNTAERTDLTVVDLGSVQQCVSCELVTYCELFALAKVTVDIIDVDDSLIGRSICRSLCGSLGGSLSRSVSRSVGRCICGSIGRLYAASSEGTLEFEVGLYDLASVDDSGKIIVCNCKGSHCIGDGSLAGCGYLILGNDQRAVICVEVERIFIKVRCRSVVGDSAYDTCVSSGLFLCYREYLIDILEGCAGSLNVLLIDLFEDGIGVSLLALQGADVTAAEVSAVQIGVYGELVADVEFLNVFNFACETVDGYDSLITGYRCICGSLGGCICGCICRSLCGSLGRSFCGSLGRSLCGSLGRSFGRSFCGSLGRSLCGFLSRSLGGFVGRSLGGNISGREEGTSE